MKINRLRLLGFKSFVEPTDLVIERGLTGVVGPNGCGKSNLLEALRWVMGETSHKSMRAAAMDDVIFSGTTSRPARNSSEVTIFLDNTERLAPAEFNDTDLIEITRRIEREAGSAYRINGKEVRARDVKILFEDAATGARSPALVRQGQIAEVVNAKPEQRRRILEDAAGIAGLHSRRHEAELRLRAAEANLARLNDILGGLNSQIESLKRQARAARRYKELSGEIRKQEALVSYLSWADAQAQVDAEEAALTDALTRVAAAAEVESRALRHEAERAEGLPPLRDAEAAKGAALGRIRIEQEAFEREAERLAQRERELKARAEQLGRDRAREESFIAESREILAGLEREIEMLVAAEEGADRNIDEARGAFDRTIAGLGAAESELSRLTAEAAEVRAHRRSLEAAAAERGDVIAKIERQIMALAVQTREVTGRAPDAIKLAETSEAGQRLARETAEIEARMLSAEERVEELARVAKAKREEAQKAKLDAGAIAAERETLAKLLVPVRDDGLAPIVDSLEVAPGYEAALGAALGDDLEAPASTESPVHWRLVAVASTDAALPGEIEPLSLNVEAPPELARRLRQIGVVSREDGPRLQPLLRPGQRLVSKEGDLWRWDGFVAAADGVTPAAQRLAGLNRLREIDRREERSQEDADHLADAEAAAADALAAAEVEERQVRQLWRDCQARLADAREALTRIEQQARETEDRLQALAEAKARFDDDMMEAIGRRSEVDAALARLDQADDVEVRLATAQTHAADQRNAAAEARARLAALEREREIRLQRNAVAMAERERWQTRSAGATEQIATLKGRFEETEAELQGLAGLPAEIANKRQGLLDAVERAETERRSAADRLAEAETAQRAAVQALRAAQADVSAEREARARIETRLENARTRRQDEARRIRETFERAPEDCLALADHPRGKPLPVLADIDRILQKLKADRERLGGVNLQADDDLSVLIAQFTSLETEKSDVEQAVGKLRGAIGQLNREGKKRLDEAFETVNGHFQSLFTTLFGGGEARLEMLEGEDPLEGGLEIIAKPPGKKPATLSLLSGGEQSLTAMSLIFAVFLTNPSPICVLDEVDAPLDDSNVDRFCTLMEKMAHDTDTRFLVITHHPMTMTRMNRLFGVTMAEKGVSQLVSVDLETAQSYREAV
jgi:chromosome segregation protein